MSAAQPQLLTAWNRDWNTGWDRDWYVNGKDGPLRCAVVGCGKIFRTEEEFKHRLDHAVKPNKDPLLNDIARANIEFHHEVLRAICAVRECPMCPPGKYVRPRPTNMPPDQLDPDIRPLIDHFAREHSAYGLTVPKKCIWYIRKYRARNFGGGLSIWRGLYEYYERNIQDQPEYDDFKDYLVGNLRMYEPNLLDEILQPDRDPYKGPVFEDEKVEDYQKFYPVDPAAFLRSFPAPSTQIPRLTYVWNTMMRKYDLADI